MFLGHPPVDEFSFRNREGESFWGSGTAEGAVVTLEQLYISHM